MHSDLFTMSYNVFLVLMLPMPFRAAVISLKEIYHQSAQLSNSIKYGQRLKLLDQHYRKNMWSSDQYSTPFKRITRLYHGLSKKRKSRKHLAMTNDTVDANGNDRTNEAHLVIESDSFGRIKIHSFQNPEYYLCIGDDEKPKGIKKSEFDSGKRDMRDCVFQEVFENKYVQFRSLRYYSALDNTGCLGFNRLGVGRRISKSKCSHKSTLFIERNARIIIDINSSGSFRKQLFDLLRHSNS